MSLELCLCLSPSLLLASCVLWAFKCRCSVFCGVIPGVAARVVREKHVRMTSFLLWELQQSQKPLTVICNVLNAE